MFKDSKWNLIKKAGFAFLLAGVSVASAAEYSKNEVIVKYKPGVVRTRTTMNQFYDSLGVKSVKHYSGIMLGFEQLVLNDNVKVQDAVAQLKKNSLVEYAQPNYILKALPIRKFNNPPIPGGGGIPCVPGFDIPNCDPKAKMPCLMPGFPPNCQANGGPTPAPTQDPPNPSPDPDPTSPPTADRPALQPAPADVNPPVADPALSKTYGMDKIGASQAWSEYRGNKDFIVAVIDTGIDYNHEDLAFNVWRNPHPTNGDVVGFDFIHNDGLPFDDNEHGTHTSGTIGAVGGNGIGVSGVNQRVSIMAVKFLSGEGSGTTADAIRAIDYAVANGAKVLSNSWGGTGDDDNKALHDAIDRAKDKNVLFVAAAGNDGADNDGSNPSFPAAFDNDNLISVAATDENDEMAFFSNYGLKTTHVAAPGTNVYSTVPGNKYDSLSGTSMACPHVAGAAAFIWSKNPSWTYKQVKDALMKTVDALPTLQGKTVSGGRINVMKALHFTE